MDITCDLSIIPDWIWGIMTLAQEARSEPLDGMIGVAEVIRNRMRIKFFSNGTVRDTVLRPYQFSGWNTGDPNRIACSSLAWDDPRMSDLIKAWKIAFENDSDLTSSAVNYHADYVDPDWAHSGEFVRTTKIGKQIFYKKVQATI